jgi:hypothetical protein
MMKYYIRLVFTLLTLSLILNFFSFSSVEAQSLPNKLNFYIPTVQINGQRLPVKTESNTNYVFEGTLSENDFIRYGWDAAVLDLGYKTYPEVGGGWMQIYLNDDSKPENAIVENGTSPLPVSKIASRLSPGKNTIMLSYVDYRNNPLLSQSKIRFTFNYQPKALQSSIALFEPPVNSLLMKEAQRNFKLELTNFSLTENNNLNFKENPTMGKLKVFVNDKNSKPLITLNKSTDIGNGKSIVEFSSKDFDPEINIADSKNSNFIFVLTKPDGEPINTEVSRNFVTNYNQTLKDIGLPELRIIEPRSDRIDLTVDRERKFIVEIKNFELLSELNPNGNEDKKGYLQIFVDNDLIKTIWTKTEFTLNEIGWPDTTEGKKTVRLQLVNKDNTKLTPNVSDSIDIIYKNNTVVNNNKSTNNADFDSNNWRLFIAGSMVLIIIFGILILVIKG